MHATFAICWKTMMGASWVRDWQSGTCFSTFIMKTNSICVCIYIYLWKLTKFRNHKCFQKPVYSISIHGSKSVNSGTLFQKADTLIRGAPWLILGIILGCSPTLLSEAGSLHRNQSSLTKLTLLASLLPDPQSPHSQGRAISRQPHPWWYTPLFWATPSAGDQYKGIVRRKIWPGGGGACS